MKTYNPQLSVKLIKAFLRKEIVPGVPVILDRYGNLQGIDLTPMLGDGSSVQTNKSVRQPAGAFAITVVDKAVSTSLFETVYAMIEPMDMIEIRMSRQVLTNNNKEGQPWLIMRGFVSAVTRNEAMQGDRPSRSVTITGQDFGKILQILQVNYTYNLMIGEYFLNEFRWFENFAQATDIKTMSAGTFVTMITENVINPYMAGIASLARFDNAVKSMRPKVSIDGWVSPLTLNSFDNCSFYSLLTTCLDVPVFNELYVEDQIDGIDLVVRPMPLKHLDGSYIQGFAKEWAIDSEEIIAQTVTRTDAQVANFYWVTNQRWSLQNDMDQRMLAMAGNPASFISTGYLNSEQKYFGIRKMDAESTLGPADYRNCDAVVKEDCGQQTQTLEDWLVSRRALLMELNKDNVIYESGMLRLRGCEIIKAGMYLSIYRGTNRTLIGEVYAHTVTHDFIPYQGFFTTVLFDRGTLFANRSQHKVPVYIDEYETQGIR
jgi:hypothetical protein